MKKFIKKLLACAVMGFSLFMFTACGEVKVTLYYGDSNKQIKVAKDNTTEILDEINSLAAEGYEVKAIYFDKEYTNIWNQTDEIGKNKNLYIEWQGIEYNVKFDSNFATSGTMADQVIRYGQSVAALQSNTYSKTGYTFMGWATTRERADHGTVDYVNESTFTMNSINGVTLYAVWQARQYQVTFNANGGSGTMEPQTITYDSASALKANAFTRAGYTFTGWNTAEDGSGMSYPDVCSYTMINEGITLYAQWTANTYSVKFDSNGGNSGEAMANLQIKFDSSKLLTTNTFTKQGYYFIGWNTRADGEGISYAENAEFEMNVANDVTLYAQWVRESYNLTLKDGDTTLFVLNNAAYESTIAEHGSFNNATLQALIASKHDEGYAFGGFFVNGDYSTTRFNLDTPIADLGSHNLAVTLSIRWATLTSAITLNYDGATSGNTVSTINAQFDTAIGELPVPAKTGYTFIGWYTSTTTFTSATKVTSTTVWEDNFSQIYAKFVSNTQPFAITYDLDGGVFDSGNPKIEVYYVNADTELVAPSKVGYDFVSFTLSEVAIINGVETAVGTELPKTPSGVCYIPQGTFGAISIKANYTVKDFTITVDYDGGENVETQTATYTIENDTVLVDAAKTAYDFAGYVLAEAAYINGTLRQAGYALPKNSQGKYFIPVGSYGNLSLKATYTATPYTITYDLGENGSFVATKPSENYTILTSINIPSVIRAGYDFLGFALGNDAVIGGEVATEGTMLEKVGDVYVIPTGSYGNLTIVAQYQIQTHSVTFKLAPDEEAILTLTGDFNSDISTLTGYNETLILDGMTKAGYAFDGWYTSLENRNDSTKFNFKISHQDIVVYPYYVAQLAAPTNISMEQESTIIKWDAVDGADYYLVRIDGGEEQICYYTQYETGLITAAADTYLIEVKAISTYKGYLDEDINSDYTEFTFIRNKSLQNAMIAVRNQDETLNKYVMFTQNTYNFTSTAYSVYIENLSEEGVASVTHVTNEETGAVTSTIVAHKPGTFTFHIDFNSQEDARYDVLVVENVSSLSYGEAYAQYLTNTDEEKTKYLNKEFDPYFAGTQNGFAVDFVLKDPNGDVFTDYDIANEELVSYSYKVYNATSGTYVDALQDEIPVRITKEHIAARSVTVGSRAITLSEFDKAGMLLFDSANAGKQYKITVTLTYSRNITSTNTFGTISTDFVVTLNDAMNAHSHEELKAYYANKDVHEINVLRNITFSALTSDVEADIPTGATTLSVDQVQPDGSPIATTSKYVYDSDSTTSNGGDAVYKTDGNIYKRAFGLDSEGYDGVGDNIKVNGNYCTIDISAINPVNAAYSINDSSGPNPEAYNQVGLMWSKTTNYSLIRPHVGVFRYQVPHGDGAIFNNLEIIGNKPTGKVPSTDPNFGERILRESASYTGFYVETSKVTLNNVIMSRLHNGVRMDGDLVDWGMEGETFVVKTPNNGQIETNFSKITDVYGHALYSWQGKEIRAYNSYFGYCGGPAILFTDEGTPQFPTIVIDKNTVFDNYLTGTESWFVVYNQTVLAQSLKTLLQQAVNSMGASVLKTIDGIEYANFSVAYMPCSNTDTSKYLEDGRYIQGVDLPRISECTFYIGGEKTVIDGKNRSTGVVTKRGGIDYLNSGDPRIQGGLHAFGVTPAVETMDFNFASIAGQYLLTDDTIKACAIQYALADAIAAVTYNSNKATYDGMGIGINEIAAELKATNFNNALTALKGYAEANHSVPAAYYTISEEIFAAFANNLAEYGVLRNYMTAEMKVFADENGDYITMGGNKVYDAGAIQSYVTTCRNGLFDGIAEALANEPAQPKEAILAAINLKYSYEFFYDLCKINGREQLVTLTSIQNAAGGNTPQAGAAVVQFMLLKMCDAANLQSQFIEVNSPTAEQGLMSVFIGYGFQDEEGWA